VHAIAERYVSATDAVAVLSASTTALSVHTSSASRHAMGSLVVWEEEAVRRRACQSLAVSGEGIPSGLKVVASEEENDMR
jgi:hypothetical protein